MIRVVIDTNIFVSSFFGGNPKKIIDLWKNEDTFASGLAHEVRNPLNSIALQLSILERRVAPLPAGVTGEIKELVGVIREEVKRLDNLVGDFLQFSRSNRVQYRPASLDALVDEVTRASSAPRRGRPGSPCGGSGWASRFPTSAWTPRR